MSNNIFFLFKISPNDPMENSNMVINKKYVTLVTIIILILNIIFYE